METIYELTQEGRLVFQGAEEDSCYIKLQRVQPQSASYAMRYSGYKVTPKQVSKEEFEAVAQQDPWYHVDVILMEEMKPNMNWVKVVTVKDGKNGTAGFNGMRYNGREKGTQVSVMRTYLKLDQDNQ